MLYETPKRIWQQNYCLVKTLGFRGTPGGGGELPLMVTPGTKCLRASQMEAKTCVWRNNAGKRSLKPPWGPRVGWKICEAELSSHLDPLCRGSLLQKVPNGLPCQSPNDLEGPGPCELFTPCPKSKTR